MTDHTTFPEGASADVSAVETIACPSRSSRIGNVLQIVGLVCLFAASFFGWALWQTGATRFVLPYLRGERVLYEPVHIRIGAAPGGEIVERTVRFFNLASGELKLLGSQQSCGCITLDDFPITIPPNGDYAVTMKFGVPVDEESFEHSIKVFTDYGGSTAAVIVVSGTVN